MRVEPRIAEVDSRTGVRYLRSPCSFVTVAVAVVIGSLLVLSCRSSSDFVPGLGAELASSARTGSKSQRLLGSSAPTRRDYSTQGPQRQSDPSPLIRLT